MSTVTVEMTLDQQIEIVERQLAELKQKRYQEGMVEAGEIERQAEIRRQREKRANPQQLITATTSDDQLTAIARNVGYSAGLPEWFVSQMLVIAREVERLKEKGVHDGNEHIQRHADHTS